MTYKGFFAALLVSLSVAGCERGGSEAGKGAPITSQQVERQLEKAVVVMDDAAITATIKTILIAEPRLKGLAIDVDTSNNVVTLRGAVASEEARRDAERIAKGVSGVKDVRNNLTVKAKS